MKKKEEGKKEAYEERREEVEHRDKDEDEDKDKDESNYCQEIWIDF